MLKYWGKKLKLLGIQASGCMPLKDIFKQKTNYLMENDDCSSLKSIPNTSNECLPQIKRLKSISRYENKDVVD